MPETDATTGPAGVPAPFEIADAHVAPGTRADLSLPTALLVSGETLTMPVVVLHGASPGPTAWVSAAVHGDEINGVEIVPRVLRQLDPKTMSGTVIAVPVVNVHGFISGSRYLPDRRDLNRSFPGSASGSLASQVAHLFTKEVVKRSDAGVDLHTGSGGRTNLPQIRADLDDPKTRALAEAFAAPVMLHARTLDGSLRRTAVKAGATVLLYESGEAHRFDEDAITAGVAGVLRVFAALGICADLAEPAPPSLVSRASSWQRAPRSGVLHLAVKAGERVTKGQLLATVDTTLDERLGRIRARHDAVVIGHAVSPLVNRGDAVVHLATIEA